MELPGRGSGEVLNHRLGTPWRGRTPVEKAEPEHVLSTFEGA
ncbi:hypothetical protein ACFYW1_28070 [Streptomyces sp. NPDC002669]